MESRVKKLKDISLLITDGKHGDCRNEKDSGYYFLSVKDIKNGILLYDNARQIKKEDFIEVNKRTQLEPHDILLSNSGTIGRLAIAQNNRITLRTTFQKSVAIIKPNIEYVDTYWLYYYLKSNINELIKFAGGTAQKNLLLKDLRDFKVKIPSFINQRKIANVLKNYDSLIENNNRRIEILEETVQAIYKEWFVHFRFPEHEKVKMIDSELGKIPERWRIYNLGKLANIIKENYNETYHKNLPLLDLSRIPKKSLIVNNYGAFNEIKTSRIIFKEGDVLFGSIRPYFHKVIFAMKKGITNVSVLVIRANNESMFPYLFWYLFDENTIRWATKQSGGTKMPVISWKILKRKKIIFPDSEIIYKFNKEMFPLIELIKVLNKKNEILARSRNILLPKLISGEISVENLDIKTEDDIK